MAENLSTITQLLRENIEQGKSTRIHIDQIDTEGRGRQTYDNIPALAESIRRIGLLHPIVVSLIKREDGEDGEDGEARYSLVAGGRRLRAVQFLSHTHIDSIVRDTLTQLEIHILELEENINREELTWQEKAMMFAEAHRLLESETHQKWTMEAMGKKLNVVKSTVSEYLSLASAIRRGDVDVLRCQTKNTAMQALLSKEERAIREELGKRRLQQQEIIEDEEDEDNEDNEEDEEDSENKRIPETMRKSPRLQTKMWSLINKDCTEGIKNIPSACIHMILTDPIYGLSDDMKLFQREQPHYSDSVDILQKYIHVLGIEFYRVLTEDAHIYIFTAFDSIPLWRNTLAEAGFDVMPIPLVWMKERGTMSGAVATQDTYANRVEYIIFARKGVLRLNTHRDNVFIYSRIHPDKRLVQTQKPVTLLRELISISSQPGNTVLDCFAGSGSTLAAATMEGRFSVGFEIDNSVYLRAQTYIEELITYEQGNG
jgi:site-specific DNA-methyltransferase (adenine-specific)